MLSVAGNSIGDAGVEALNKPLLSACSRGWDYNVMVEKAIACSVRRPSGSQPCTGIAIAIAAVILPSHVRHLFCHAVSLSSESSVVPTCTIYCLLAASSAFVEEAGRAGAWHGPPHCSRTAQLSILIFQVY